MNVGKNTLKLFFIAILVISVLYGEEIDTAKFVHLVANFKVKHFITLTVLFICNFFLSSLRTFLSYRQFKINVSYPAAMDALLSSQLGGIVPIFGSVISQSLTLNKSSNVSSSTSAFIYFYDKILMAAVGGSLCLASALYIFKDVHIVNAVLGEPSNVSLFEFIMVIMLSLLVGFFYVIPKSEREKYLKYINLRVSLYILLAMLVNLSVWICSALCFWYCINIINGGTASVNNIQVLTASAIVSFIASLPLSVNGWGVREFAALTIFPLVLISKEIALASATIVGVISFITLMLIAVMINITYKKWVKIENAT